MIRQRIETLFGGFAKLVCRNPVLAILVVLLITATAASGLRNIVIDTSTESFLYPDDPILVRYEEFRAQFGRDDIIVIAVEPGELFAHDSLSRLKALHEDLASGVPHLASITSMVNARNTRGEDDRLVVGDLLESWPETEADLAALRKRVLANPLYRNLLVSADGRVTTVVLELARTADAPMSVDSALALFDAPPPLFEGPEVLSDEDTHQALSAVRDIVADHRGGGFELRIAGTPAVTDTLKIALQDDMKRSIGLAIAVIAILLLVMFRSPTAVLLPVGVVVMALLSTLGIMGHVGTSLKLPTVILPSFLLAVGVGSAVHLLAIHFRNIAAGMDRHSAIVGAVSHAGLPILLTSLTTAAGIGSFSFAEVAPIAELGGYAAIGVLLALAYTLILLPAGLALLPQLRIPGAGRAGRASAWLDRVLVTLAGWSVRHARPIAGASLVMIMVSTGLASQLRFSHDILAWLPDDWPVHRATRSIDHDLGGSVSLEVVVDTGVENGLHDRDLLLSLESLGQDITAASAGTPVPVGAVLSVVDLLKEIHRALNENRLDHHRIPENPALIPQEFLLFENSGSDDLEDLVDTQFSVARFSMRVPWRDTLEYPPFIVDVENRFVAAFGADVEVTVTGIMSLLSRTLDAAIRSAARSYVIAFGVITLMMMALIGRAGTGLISMIPNLAPIALALALMQVAGIPLNLFTMLVGSIAIGLAVDDTVHFMHHFHRYLAHTGSVEESVCRTLQTSGRAMLVTSIVLSAGFFIFCLADMKNLVDFGLLTGMTILTALAADFIVAPALMALRYRHLVVTEDQPRKGDLE